MLYRYDCRDEAGESVCKTGFALSCLALEIRGYTNIHEDLGCLLTKPQKRAYFLFLCSNSFLTIDFFLPFVSLILGQLNSQSITPEAQAF